jgi:hypothetical protein
MTLIWSAVTSEVARASRPRITRKMRVPQSPLSIPLLPGLDSKAAEA